MDIPSVSVVLMIRGQQRHTVLRALESVFAQTAGNLKIIISDTDPSEYGTGVRMQEDFSDDSRVTFAVNRPEYAGLSFKNALLSSIGTEFVSFMDAGEVWKPEKIENQLGIIRSSKDISAVYCNGRMYYSEKGRVRVEKCFSNAEGSMADRVTNHPIKAPGQILYRTDSLNAIGGFNGKLTELSDMDAIFRLGDIGSVAKTDEILIEYNVSGSAARRKREFLDQESLLGYKRYIDMILSEKRVCFEFYLSLVRLAVRANMPIETAQYAFIMALRSPLRTAKYVFGTLKKLIVGAADILSKRKLCNKYLLDIRKKILSKEDPAEHSYTTRKKPERKTLPESDEIADLVSKRFSFIGNGFNGVLIIPDGVTEIAEGAFAGCKSVRRVVLAGSVRKIGAKAFMDCKGLETVVCNSNSHLSEIDGYAFAGCSGLVSVSLPNSVSSIGKGAFIGCASLKNLDFISIASSDRENGMLAEHIVKIEEECFAGCRSLEKALVGKGSLLREFGRYSFFDCRSLRLLWVEAAVEIFSEHAFEGCISLAEIVMSKSESVKKLGDYVFAGCEKIYHFAMPPAVAVIPRGAFIGCSNLQGITLPIRVQKVRRDAFVNCRSMLSCVVENPEAKVSSKAFSKYTKVEFKSSKDLDGDISDGAEKEK